MSEVVIAGIGQVPVGEHWELSLRTLAARAIRAALKDAGNLQPQIMFIGNYLAPMVSHQSNLGPLFADNSGLEGLESLDDATMVVVPDLMTALPGQKLDLGHLPAGIARDQRIVVQQVVGHDFSAGNIRLQ